MTRLSIIIPVLGRVQAFEEGLVSVLENRPQGTELLVVLNGPYADPYALGDEVRFVSAGTGAGWAASIACGWQAAQAPIVHTLAAGARVSEGWADAALACFEDETVGAVAPLVMQARKLVSAGLEQGSLGARQHRGVGRDLPAAARLSRNVLGASYLAGFFRREAIESAGGIGPECGDAVADLDLALRLDRAGWRCLYAPNSQVTAEVAEPPVGAFQRGRQEQRLRWRQAGSGGLRRAWRQLPLACLSDLRRHFSPRVALAWLGRLSACFSARRDSRQWDEQAAAENTPATLPMARPAASPQFAAARRKAG